MPARARGGGRGVVVVVDGDGGAVVVVLDVVVVVVQRSSGSGLESSAGRDDRRRAGARGGSITAASMVGCRVRHSSLSRGQVAVGRRSTRSRMSGGQGNDVEEIKLGALELGGIWNQPMYSYMLVPRSVEARLYRRSRPQEAPPRHLDGALLDRQKVRKGRSDEIIEGLGPVVVARHTSTCVPRHEYLYLATAATSRMLSFLRDDLSHNSRRDA